MKSNQKNLLVFLSTAAVLSACYAFLESRVGSDSTGITTLLRVSGRVSLLIFLLIFIARPLRQLAGWPSNNWLMRNRRYFGIAFAASHSVHLYFIILLWQSVVDTVFPLQTLIVGGTGFTLMYLMLVTSFDRPARAIGPQTWRRLHKTGLYWIGTIFVFDFFVKPFSQPSFTPYWPFSILIAVAIAIRLMAWRANRHRQKIRDATA